MSTHFWPSRGQLWIFTRIKDGASLNIGQDFDSMCLCCRNQTALSAGHSLDPSFTLTQVLMMWLEGRKEKRGDRKCFSSPPVWCDLHLWEASLSLYASLPESRKGRSGTHSTRIVGDLLGNTILIHCPNKAAKSHYLYTINKGLKILPCIL